MRQTEVNRLKKNWSILCKLWIHYKRKYKLSGWKLKSMNSKSSAGLCSYGSKTIYISTYFLRGHNCEYQKIRKVLLHEIAHSLKPGHGHGKEWKSLCIKIGGDDRLAVTMVPNGMKWAMICSICNWRQEYMKRPGNNLICGFCKNRLKIKYIE